MVSKTTSSTSAIVFREVGGPVKFETISLGTLQPNEALIEIHATGVCHTDLSCIDGTLPIAVPNVLGHEGAGIVLSTGSTVTNVSPGDKVLLSYNFCGNCASCTSGHPAYCATWTALNFGGVRADGSIALKDEKGVDVHCNFFGQSSFGRHAIVSASSMVKVPAETDLKLYAALGCGLQTGAGAVLNSLRVTKGSSLVVWGVGPVGLAAVMAGVLAGSRTIIAIDLQQDRLKLAQEMGATDIVDGKDADVAKQVIELSGANGADFAVDCTGVPNVVENMINSLGTRGRGCSVGAPKPGSVASVDIFSHLLFAREYIGCVEGDANPPKMIPYLIEQHKAGRFPLEKMIKYYAAKDFQVAFDDMKATKAIKPVLVWSD